MENTQPTFIVFVTPGPDPKPPQPFNQSHGKDVVHQPRPWQHLPENCTELPRSSRVGEAGSGWLNWLVGWLVCLFVHSFVGFLVPRYIRKADPVFCEISTHVELTKKRVILALQSKPHGGHSPPGRAGLFGLSPSILEFTCKISPKTVKSN